MIKIIYIMDPLCGWCYGNSTNILRLEQELVGKIQIEVLPGGMWIGDRVRYQSSELVGFIRSADARLRSVTLVEMTDTYDRLLDDTSVLLDSEPGCRAINTIKSMNPSLAITFASMLAHARYVDGLDNTIFSTFLSIVTHMGLDVTDFSRRYESDDMIQLTLDTFALAGKYTQSYPSMFLELDEYSFVPISIANYHYDEQKNQIEAYL